MLRKIGTRIVPIPVKTRLNPFLLFLLIATKVYAYNYVLIIISALIIELFFSTILFLFVLSLEEFSHIATALGRRALDDSESSKPELIVKYVSICNIPVVCTQVYVNIRSNKMSPVDLVHIYIGGPMFCIFFISAVLLLFSLMNANIFYIRASVCLFILPAISLTPMPFKRFRSTDGYRIREVSKKYTVNFLQILKCAFRSIIYIFQYVVFPQKCAIKYNNPLLNSNLNSDLVRLHNECEYNKLLEKYKELRYHSFQTRLIKNNIKWIKAKLKGE